MNNIYEIQSIINERFKKGNFRNELLSLIPDNINRLLEFGYGDGTLLLAAKLTKDVKTICGIDIVKNTVSKHFNNSWHMDLSDKNNDIGESYHGFFECIISTNTLEHVYDPWFVLSKLRRYLTLDGTLIAEVPNIQCWESLYRIAVGEFPYTSGAHFDSTHIRWYTIHSFVEMLEFVGYEPVDIYPVGFHTDLSFLTKIKEIKSIELPPPGIPSDAPKIVLRFPVDMKPMYPFFVAPRFIVKAARGDTPLKDRKVGYHMEFEEFRLTHKRTCQLIPQLIRPPINRNVAEQLSKKLEKNIKFTL